MKKGSAKAQGNAFDSLEGAEKHRDAQRLEAIREALPPWTQDESCSASVPRERLTHDDHHYYLLEDAMAGEPFGCTQ